MDLLVAVLLILLGMWLVLSIYRMLEESAHQKRKEKYLKEIVDKLGWIKNISAR